MNSKSIQIEYSNQADFAHITSAPISKIALICKKVVGFLIRSELQKAQDHYRAKQHHDFRNKTTQDAFQGLAIEQKMRYGMYRYMD